jgi:hypothetical protein
LKTDGRDLLIIACSARKKHVDRAIPAIELYDGPAYRMLRKRLSGAPNKLVIWVLSAKHGLMWADSPIFWYDERLENDKLLLIKQDVESFIERNAKPSSFDSIYIWAGKKYLETLPPSFLTRSNVKIAKGPIGKKLGQLKSWCLRWNENGRKISTSENRQLLTSKLRLQNAVLLTYLIPDWDDYLDPEYNFAEDKFSWSSGERKRLYAHELFKNKPLYDGVLVSLGHIVMGKGPARNGLKAEGAIGSARDYLHLGPHHILMGDCGAFSYRRSTVPPFTTDKVIQLYNDLQVDIGASIDHIPFGEVEEEGNELRPLNTLEIENRIELTAKLACEFMHSARYNSTFAPMGVIQARTPDEYASVAKEYVRIGYDYIALGGLVPRKDDDILNITEATISAINQAYPISYSRIRIHLFGVLREGLLPHLHKLGISSFDSGSYLRKAWLRSDKNYLSPSDKWYSAIRIPYSSDPRFQKNAMEKGITLSKLQQLEAECLQLLREYQEKRYGLPDILDKIVQYDSLLLRTSDTNDLREKYEMTLKDAPWEQCDCPVCRNLGINVVIFRGFNRNKRRGFHNTRMFYQQLLKVREGVA